MRNHKRSFQVFRFSNAVIIVCCITLLGVGARVSTKKHQHADIQQQLEELKRNFKVQDLRVTNRTSGFEIVGLEKTVDGNIRISLRNNYGKGITAYQISLGSTTTLVEKMLNISEDSIIPGATISWFEGLNVDPDLDKKGLVIRGVVFDDGTADGDTGSIKEINDYRRGEMIQMNRTVTLLSQALVATDNDISAALDRVINEVPLSTDVGGSRKPDQLRFGVQDTRKYIASFLLNINGQLSGTVRTRINELFNYCNNKSTQLSLYNSAVEINNRSKASSR